MAPSNRIVCWFSCGAASAVATKLAITANAGKLPLVIAYTAIHEEHPDNERFLHDCEAWYRMPIQRLQNEKYSGSIYDVFAKTRYLVGPSGAACTRLLKKDMRKRFELPNDQQVFGYTSEEQDRFDRFLDANNIDAVAPLILKGLTKSDCLGLLQRQGIELPAMYKLGYPNNNCIGCVKCGAGYWNKIRVDFPETFEKMARMEEHLGRRIVKATHNGKYQLVTLRQLSPDAGNILKEPSIECGIFCEMAEHEMKGGQQ